MISKEYIISTSDLRQNQFELSNPEHLNHGTNDAHIPVLRVHPYLSLPVKKAAKIKLYFSQPYNKTKSTKIKSIATRL